ncbi:MAG: 4Fe-4S binding protein [Kiritimatiellia bacterium]|jgi:Pyruvate/2-oxoacid:ferredoxin oxidoreductase delta subunit|nr:4Fe-4S binding protein [Kiritimatiellia bacterium]MDP6629742.1 4Fe-4S binding protein [Kiritimatiellia bacterium]MDP6811018.1 4Fe-4S binding protein [Kiritimatiellia bacterium]MDP7023127.1 4Fe-4S binding protein [Kiritimatiellia bacterium]
MKRKIIKIDEDLCNGCGNCITACAEGALELVDGKAKIVKDLLCDGFGDCMGECPTGALTIEERDCAAFDQQAVEEHLLESSGQAAVDRMKAAAERHVPKPETPPPLPHGGGGCPGTRMRMAKPEAAVEPTTTGAGVPGQVIKSDLQQWPVQLHLVSPGAPFFMNKELVVLSTCAPIASADAHWRYIRGRGVVVACPKLDRTEPYVGKLAAILQDKTIPKVICLRMEVPCCGGLTHIVEQAIAESGRTDLVFEEVTVGVDGTIR